MVSAESLKALLLRASATFGHDGFMPKRLPFPEMLETAVAAYLAISGTARLIVLMYLLDHPGSTRPAIMADTGISPNAATAAWPSSRSWAM